MKNNKHFNKIQQTDIDTAKQVDIYKVLDYFNWETDATTNTFILCPRAEHKDKHPKVYIDKNKNTCRCQVCEQTFDTISLVQNLSYKVNGVELPFPKAVKTIFQIDNNNTVKVQSTSTVALEPEEETRTELTTQSRCSLYDYILKKSTPITGYEIKYLQDRGIFLYPTYVYKGNVYSERDLKKLSDKALCKEIKEQGTLYNGIANILKSNHIEIKHNYYKDTNYILYVVDYDYDNDKVLQSYAKYLKDTSRQMIIQKAIDKNKPHDKKNQNPTDFCIIAEGIDSNDIYICEGMEDALSFVQNGYKAISLNSTSNMDSLIDYFQYTYEYKKTDNFILALDHDEAGQKATQKLTDYFEEHNSMKKYHHFKYQLCKFPEICNDINDYWVKRIFER